MDSDEAVVQEAASAVAEAAPAAAADTCGTALAEFQSYLDGFDRTAEGAGSSKGTDRYSGMDVRTNVAKGKSWV